MARLIARLYASNITLHQTHFRAFHCDLCACVRALPPSASANPGRIFDNVARHDNGPAFSRRINRFPLSGSTLARMPQERGRERWKISPR